MRAGSFDEHDMDVNERLARVEGKLDLVITNQTGHQNEHDAIWLKIDEHDDCIKQVKTEKDVYGRVITFILTALSWILGGLTTQYIRSRI